MRVGRVTGTVVTTITLPVYEQRRLLVCDLLGGDGEPTGDYLVAVDTVEAGEGELVLLLDEGNSARQIVGDPDGPVRAVVVGTVDDWTV